MCAPSLTKGQSNQEPSPVGEGGPLAVDEVFPKSILLAGKWIRFLNVPPCASSWGSRSRRFEGSGQRRMLPFEGIDSSTPLTLRSEWQGQRGSADKDLFHNLLPLSTDRRGRRSLRILQIFAFFKRAFLHRSPFFQKAEKYWIRRRGFFCEKQRKSRPFLDSWGVKCYTFSE